jgi:cytochrome P450
MKSDPSFPSFCRKYESQLMTILLGVFPSILARTGLRARDRIAQAFEQYFHSGGIEEASVLMHNRYEVGARNGVPVADIARYEVGGVIAILVNTAPAAFWLMYFVYADAKLLEDIRKEVGAIVEVRQDPNGGTIRSLDITNLKTSCPLLLSAFQETLRHRSMGTSVREVMTDTILDGKWLLKKDSMIQMPSRVIHLDSDIWGNDVHEFKAGRFLSGTGKEKSKDQKRANPAAFRAFGGGSTLCPGRHFATNEILAIVSMFVMRFDMKPVFGHWKLPKTDNTNVAAVIMEPDTDIEVVVSVREGFEDAKWAFSLRDSEMIFAVVDEDRAA